MSTRIDHSAVSRLYGMAAAAQGWALVLGFKAGARAAASRPRGVAMIAATPVGAVKLRAARAVAWFGAALLVMVWVAIYASLSSERTRVLADTRADTANLARAFDEHIQRTIAGLDQTLLYLRAEFQQAPDRFDLNRSVANNVILKRVSVQIARIDADGMLADSNVPGFTHMDLSDREHFRVHKAAVKDELFISKPVLGRASGKWSIQLTRRLEDGHGNFAGVLVVSLDPNYLGDIYGSIDVGENGAIAVIGTDGVVRVASHGGGGFLGKSLQGGAILEAVRRQEATTLESNGPLDGIDRISSLRPLPNVPLSVLVGRSKVEAMAVYDRSVTWHLLIGAAVTLALGAALIALYRMVRAQEGIAADLAVKKSGIAGQPCPFAPLCRRSGTYRRGRRPRSSGTVAPGGRLCPVAVQSRGLGPRR